MHEEDFAWAAGLFDGEGSTTTGGDNDYVYVVVPQSGLGRDPPQVLIRFQKIVGTGRITGPVMRPRRLPSWCFEANGARAFAGLEALSPFLGGVKRRQAEAALRRHRHHGTRRPDVALRTGRPLIVVCPRGHPYQNGVRRCRTCRSMSQARYRAKRAG